MVQAEILPPDDFPLEADSPLAEAHQLLSRYFGTSPVPLYTNNTVAWEVDARHMLPEARGARFDLLCACLDRMNRLTAEAAASEEGYRSSVSGRGRNLPSMLWALMSVLGETPLLSQAAEAEALARHVAPLFAGDMSEAGRQMPGYRVRTYHLPVEVFVRQWEQFYRTQDVTPAAREVLAGIGQALKSYSLDRINRSKLATRIERLLDKYLRPDAGERWTDAALAEVGASDAWGALFTHAETADAGKPSAKWRQEAEKNRRAVGEDEFQRRAFGWLMLAQVLPLPVPTDQTMAGDGFVVYDTAGMVRVSEKNNSILKGLAWYCSFHDSVELARGLGHMAEVAFGNIPEHGAWAKSAGNAALWALGRMPGGVGVGPLARLRTRLRDRSALKLIASSIEAAAKSVGMTVDELEDLAVPTGGLGADGMRRETFGGADADADTANLTPPVG